MLYIAILYTAIFHIVFFTCTLNTGEQNLCIYENIFLIINIYI